jgi:hypothetical protein
MMLERVSAEGQNPWQRRDLPFPDGGWSDSLGRMVPPADPDTLSPAEMQALVSAPLGKVRAGPTSSRMVWSRRPSRSRRGKVVPRVAVEARVLRARVPPGSRFRGYQDFLVQDLVLRIEAVRYRRERRLTPEGQLVVAPLPGGVDGHFGPELRRHVLARYHQAQTTVPRLVAQLRAVGIAISRRQVMRRLIAGQQPFLDEHRAVLRAARARVRELIRGVSADLKAYRRAQPRTCRISSGSAASPPDRHSFRPAYGFHEPGRTQPALAKIV